MRLPDTGFNSPHHAFYLRQHSAGNHTPLDQFIDLAQMQRRDQRGLILRIAKQPGHIRQENQFSCIERTGNRRRRIIGINVIQMAIRPLPQRRNHRNNVRAQIGLNRLDIHAIHLAYISPIQRVIGFRINTDHFIHAYNILPVDAARLAVVSLDDIHQLRVYLVVQHLFHHAGGGLVGDTQTLDKVGRDIVFLHRPRNRFSAAVHDDRAQTHTFHEGDILKDPAIAIFVSHDASAKLNHHGIAPKLLDIRQGLNQHGGLFNKLVHYTSYSTLIRTYSSVQLQV